MLPLIQDLEASASRASGFGNPARFLLEKRQAGLEQWAVAHGSPDAAAVAENRKTNPRRVTACCK